MQQSICTQSLHEVMQFFHITSLLMRTEAMTVNVAQTCPFAA